MNSPSLSELEIEVIEIDDDSDDEQLSDKTNRDAGQTRKESTLSDTADGEVELIEVNDLNGEPFDVDEDDSKEFKDDKSRNEVAVAYKAEVYNILTQSKLTGCGQFASAGKLSDAPIFAIEIEGVGKFSFPLFEEPAKKLITMAQLHSQSPLGKKAYPMFDTSPYKNVLQFEPHAFKILNPQWKTFMSTTVLPRVAAELGVGADIKAFLWKLQVFEAGSLVKPHLEPKQRKNNFGTLLIQLPSEFEGGKLVVSHVVQTKQFDLSSSMSDRISSPAFSAYFTAFYSDCQFEVLPVTTGYRTALVYNLTLPGKLATPSATNILETKAKLTNTLENWPKSEVPSKLVYILSEQYAGKDMSFKKLKNNDYNISQLVIAAASATGITTHLAELSKYEFSDEYDEYHYDYEFKKMKYQNAVLKYSLNNWISTENINVSLGSWEVSMVNEVVPNNCFGEDDDPDGEITKQTKNKMGKTKRWYSRFAIVLWPENNFVKLINAHCPKQFLSRFLKLSELWADEPRESSKWKKYFSFAGEFVKPHISTQEFVSEEQALNVLVAFIKLNNLNVLQNFLTKYWRWRESMIPEIVDQCGKYGWKTMLPVLHGSFSKTKSLSLLILLMNGDLKDEEKRNTGIQLLDIITENLAGHRKLKDSFPNLYLISRKLNYYFPHQLESKDHYVLEAVVEGIVDLAKVHASDEYCIKLVTLCMPKVEQFTSTIAPPTNWRRSANWVCYSCLDCGALKSFLTSNRVQTREFQVNRNRGRHIRDQIEAHAAKGGNVSVTWDRKVHPNVLVITKKCDDAKINQQMSIMQWSTSSLIKLKRFVGGVTASLE